MQLSRGGAVLHLSEHHGDGSQGARVRITTVGIERLYAELAEHRYGYSRPNIRRESWGDRTLTVIDPAGNHVIFHERMTP